MNVKSIDSGVVNVNKPLGITSHDVVYNLRRILGIKKIGHTGTLDPDASGVLPMCIGRATKLAEFLTASDKQYLAELTLGAFTDTQDKSGNVIESFEVNVSKDDIISAVNEFVGEIEQIPPMFSAVKHEGKRLYELAREGKSVERTPRLIKISGIEIKNIDLDKKTVTMLVNCSKGTYIRTLCNDIGKRLGCGAYMSALERTKSGRFEIGNAYTLEEIEKMVQSGDYSFLTPTGEVLSEYRRLVLAERNVWRVTNGIKISVEGLCDGEYYRLFDERGNFIALAKQTKERLLIEKTFYQGVENK